jgi:hypothetical protein
LLTWPRLYKSSSDQFCNLRNTYILAQTMRTRSRDVAQHRLETILSLSRNRVFIVRLNRPWRPVQTTNYCPLWYRTYKSISLTYPYIKGWFMYMDGEKRSVFCKNEWTVRNVPKNRFMTDAKTRIRFRCSFVPLGRISSNFVIW